jgi:hypothetical protein
MYKKHMIHFLIFSINQTTITEISFYFTFNYIVHISYILKNI